MSAFRSLKDASKNFEEELRRVSNELFSAKIEDSFEDNIAKKLRDLSVHTAKLRLLRAKPLSLNPQILENDREEDTTLAAYGETVAARTIEHQLVRSATQATAVKTLLTAPDRTLHTEMGARKEKIKYALLAYQTQEATVQHLNTLIREKEASLADLRAQWDQELTLLQEMKRNTDGRPVTDNNDALYQKLSTTVNKLELMRWLAGRLGMPRTRGYDWLGDPQRRLTAIKLAREHYSVDYFLHDT